MTPRLLTSSVLIIMAVGSAIAQTSASTPPDGLVLIRRVAQHYADAKSYRIEAVEETTLHNEYETSWRKTVITAMESFGNRYRYEGHGVFGSALRVADGKTVWTYHLEQHRYTQKAAVPDISSRATPNAEIALREAESFRNRMGNLAQGLKSATRLPDSTIKVNGHEIRCYVVRIRSSADSKRIRPEYSFERTLWIEKAHETVVRQSEHADTQMPGRVPIQKETNFTSALTLLDMPIADEYFRFQAPADAILIEDFPDPVKDGAYSLRGSKVPDLKLNSGDGKMVSLESFRGRPVLLDIWATWCPPCLSALDQTAILQAQLKNTGLVLLTIDEDEEPKKATDYLAKKGFNWPNFHDNGDLSVALGSSGVPRSILIDPQGKVIYDKVDPKEEELRAALAGLGTEYSSVAPTRQENPCK